MGLFNFFGRRRERESAIPGGSPDSVTKQLKGDGEPIGQPVQGAGQPQAFDLTSVGGLGSMFGLVQQAMQSQSIQVTQGENQVIDLRGTGAREQIMAALQQHGIDPETMQGTQIDAANVPDLQNQIMSALEQAGYDPSQWGIGDATAGEAGTDSGAAGDSSSG